MAAGETVEPGKLMARLRQERMKQDLTLEWVAGRVGVSQPSISEFESGRKKPREENLRKWLRALKLPEEWADPWVEWQIEETVAQAIAKRRGPRAMPAEDIEMVRRIIRRSWGR